METFMSTWCQRWLVSDMSKRHVKARAAHLIGRERLDLLVVLNLILKLVDLHAYVCNLHGQVSFERLQLDQRLSRILFPSARCDGGSQLHILQGFRLELAHMSTV